MITRTLFLLLVTFKGILSECIHHQVYKGISDVVVNCVDDKIEFDSSAHTLEWGTFDEKIENKPPYTLLSNRSLLIKGVSVRSSHYFCKVKNIKTKEIVYQCGTAVTIIFPLILKFTPRNETVENNTMYLIKCHAGGGDLTILTLSYFINDVKVIKNEPFAITKDTKIECLAESGDDSLRAVGFITVRRKGVLTDEEAFLQTKCENGTNNICSKVLFENSSRIYNINSKSYSLIYELLRELFVTLDNEIHLEYYENKCIDRYKRMICSILYPSCTNKIDNRFTKVPVCRESCDSILYVICRKSMSDIKKQVNKVITEFINARLLKDDNPGYVNKFIKDLNNLTSSLSKCDQLPNHVDTVSTKKCSLINLDVNPTIVANEKSEKTCYDKNGRKYIGEVSNTEQNRKCINWNQIPQLYLSFYQQSLHNDSNFCRNPGGIYNSPMCIINITKATAKLTIHDIGLAPCPYIRHCKLMSSPSNQSHGKLTIAICATVLAIVIICGLILFLYCYCKKEKSVQRKSDTMEKMPLNDDDVCLYPNKFYKQTQNGGFACPIYNAAHFEKVQTLANGEYGEIVLVQVVLDNINSINLDESLNSSYQKGSKYASHRRSSISESDNRSIDDLILSADRTFNEKTCWPFDKSTPSGCCPFAVIKYLSSSGNVQKEARFNKETKYLSQLNNPFIIRFYGVCLHISDNVICRIVEYLPNGDIKSILTGRRREPPKLSNHDNHNKAKNGYQCVDALTNRGIKSEDLNKSNDKKLFKRKTNISTQTNIEPPKPTENINLSHKQLLKWGTEICDAVLYLHTKHLIHRDIATRNCLVGCNLEAKLADFSFVQKFSYGFDLIGNATEFIPIRWLPSETLQNLIYNTDTDVYMFGVFLWELMSFGKDPYYEYELKQAFEKILAGDKLECPPQCPSEIYDQMLRCYLPPKDRPCLDVVKNNLEKILKDL